MDPRLNGSLEFQRFGAYVAQAMQAQGYAPATTPQAATLLVRDNQGGVATSSTVRNPSARAATSQAPKTARPIPRRA